MARKHAGRHRAPGFNPLSEIADIAAQGAQPAVKASAVVVASGGLLATFALPASAAPADTASGAALAAVQQAPALAPAVSAAVGSVAVAAPATAANAPTFGVVGFTGTPAVDQAPAMTIKKVVQDPPAQPTRVARTATVAATGTGVAKAAAAPAPAAPAAPAAPLAAPSGGILGAAASLSGIPYVYGGMSTSGADCSGYTSLVFRAVGISLPRTAEAQRQMATPVSSPQPGDLIFFGFPAYHVGIYAGGGMMYDNQRPGTTSGLHSIWTYNNVSYGRVG